MNHRASNTRTLHIHPLLAITAALAIAAGHASLDAHIDHEPEPEPEFGPAVSIGQGTARSFVEKNARGEPVAIGVMVTESALQGLPSGHAHHENVLELPAIHGVPFQHITFGWNPAGHPPAGIYDRPHFDVHFFTISDQQRRAIVPELPGFAQLGGRLPAEAYRPAGYMADPHGPVPLMGTHWMDPAAPELNGTPFTETLLFGSWDGELIFIEPMLSRDWLLSRTELEEPLAMPERVATAGFWPTSWSVRYDEQRGEYRIALEGLQRREAN